MRLVEVHVEKDHRDKVRELMGNHPITAAWDEESSVDRLVVKALLPVEFSETLLDALENELGESVKFRIVVLPVEATFPRPDVEVSEKEGEEEKKTEKEESHISREELRADVEETIGISRVFVLMTMLSAVVAAGGMVLESVEFVIGAMVIAPLLGPNVAFGLAMVLGDYRFALNALKAAALGVGVALISSVIIGLTVDFDIANPLIAQRTFIKMEDIILALAAGLAASLSFTTALLPALVGVMVAVALLPPIVVLGMLLGSGQWHLAGGTVLLVTANLVCINLAAISVFMLQRIKPKDEDETRRARRTGTAAIIFWLLLLAALVVLVLLS